MGDARKPPTRIRLYTSSFCASCDEARRLLERHGIAYEDVDVGMLGGCCRLHETTGGGSVPQATVDGRPVGGYGELAALIRSGVLGGATGGPGPERHVP